MKNLRLTILLAVIAAALFAAASASATTLTGAGGATLPVGTEIKAESEGVVTMDAPPGEASCKLSISGKIASAGGATETVKVPLETFTETECIPQVTAAVLKKGTLEFHTQTEGANNNGTLTWTGTELTTVIYGFHCIFATSNTDIGVVTGSTTTGGSATLDIVGSIPRSGGSSGAFCGTTSQWTGSLKFTAPSTLNIDGTPPLTGETPTPVVGETITVTWKNDGESALTIEDETNSDSSVAETVGTGCETIAATSSCTSRKVKCLKAGEVTLTATDTPSVEGQVKVKCHAIPPLTGEAPTTFVGETITVTWKNDGEIPVTIEDETNSDSSVAETVGTGCGTIAATGSCTKRSLKCLKAGEVTLTARDTPSVIGEFKVKCHTPPELTGEVSSTPFVGETATVTWKNDGELPITIDDEAFSDETVVEKTGSACTTIAATSSCTSRKVKCLKAGEVTLTARDTPSVIGEVKVKCHTPPELTGEVSSTPFVGDTVTVTWKNDGELPVTIDDETFGDGTVVEKTGSACTTIAATSSCTSRKVKCLKAGEVTLIAEDTPSVKGQVSVKCHEVIPPTGEVASTPIVGETVTVTWKNDNEIPITIDDETFSDETVVEKSGSACTTIAATSSCTSRKVKCLKKGEVTLTAQDTPSAGGQVKVKCHDFLEGGPTTANVGETVTVTWTNNTAASILIEDESTSDGTVAETLGSSCGTIASKASCTNRKIKCLKKGESTITAEDTPFLKGQFVIKCD
jgi:hypothetical protein